MRFRSVLLLVAALTVAALLLPGCALAPGDTSQARAGRVSQALLQSGVDFLGRVAFVTLRDAAQSAAGGGKIDLAHSGAQGLWSQAPSIVSDRDVQRVVQAWSGGELDTVAAAAAYAYRKADPKTPDARRVVINSLAQTLSESAFNATGMP